MKSSLRRAFSTVAVAALAGGLLSAFANPAFADHAVKVGPNSSIKSCGQDNGITGAPTTNCTNAATGQTRGVKITAVAGTFAPAALLTVAQCTAILEDTVADAGPVDTVPDKLMGGAGCNGDGLLPSPGGAPLPTCNGGYCALSTNVAFGAVPNKMVANSWGSKLVWGAFCTLQGSLPAPGICSNLAETPPLVAPYSGTTLVVGTNPLIAAANGGIPGTHTDGSGNCVGGCVYPLAEGQIIPGLADVILGFGTGLGSMRNCRPPESEIGFGTYGGYDHCNVTVLDFSSLDPVTNIPSTLEQVPVTWSAYGVKAPAPFTAVFATFDTASGIVDISGHGMASGDSVRIKLKDGSAPSCQIPQITVTARIDGSFSTLDADGDGVSMEPGDDSTSVDFTPACVLAGHKISGSAKGVTDTQYTGGYNIDDSSPADAWPYDPTPTKDGILDGPQGGAPYGWNTAKTITYLSATAV